MINTVFVAGYKNSTAGHWQREWFNQTENSYWVEQSNWDEPDCAEWVAALQAQLSSIKGPIIIVTHSLGGCTLTEWSKTFSANIVGAFIVAPPDVHCAYFPKIITGYQQPLTTTLPFTTTLVASTDDPYASLASAQLMAEAWGSELVNVGELGHINVESNLGDWPQGKALYAQFINSLNISE